MNIVHVVATLANGQLAVMQFVVRGPGASPVGSTVELDDRGKPTGFWLRPATDELVSAELERAGRAGDGAWRDGFPVVSWRIVAPAEIPVDRRFRAAWRDSGSSVAVDLQTAREIRLAELRKERDGKLAALDDEWMKAMGQKKTAGAAAVEEKRQALRDMPQTVAGALEAAKSVAEIETVTLPE